MAGGSDNACRVALVHHHKCVVLLSQVADLVHRGHIAVHGEHAVGADDAEALGLGLLEATLQVFHVGVLVAVALGLAQAHAIDDGGVVERVADDGILFGEERAEQASVGVEAGCVEDGVLGLEILRDGSLQLLVDVLRAADEAHRRHAVAAAVHHLLGSLDESGVVAQSQIVVGAEVQHFLALHLDGCALRAFDDSFFLVEAGCFQVGQGLLQMLLDFSVHNRIRF